MWIELHQSLAGSRKLLRLKELLGVKKAQAAGHLCFLWLWALDNTRDGSLAGVSDRALAEAADFPLRRAGEFVRALLEAGFLERREDGLWLHDWLDYNGRLKEMREKNAARQKKWRDKQRYAGVTVTGLQDITEQDTTQQDITQQDITKISGGGDGGGGARAGADANALEEFLDERGMLRARWLGSTPELIGRSNAWTDAIFARFASRSPTSADRATVFTRVTVWDGKGERRWDEEAVERLSYAFEQAALSGHPANWPYIDGILTNLHQRGIRNLRDAAFYDIRREEP